MVLFHVARGDVPGVRCRLWALAALVCLATLAPSARAQAITALPVIPLPGDTATGPTWADLRLASATLRFERPSDILAMWRRWRPDDPSLAPLAATSNGRDRTLRRLDFLCKSGRHYLGGCVGEGVFADDRFDDEAAAFVAMGACLAPAAWVMHERSPLLWVQEFGGQWTFNNLDFGACVRKRARGVGYLHHDSPDTPLGLRAAAMLERKLGNYLLNHKCTGRGPDDCLTLLDALLSLNPRSPQLPAVLMALAPEFAPLPRPGIAPEAARQGETGASAQPLRRRLMSQVVYLTLRLRALAARADEEVLPGEPAATLARLEPLREDLSRLDAMQGGLWPRPRVDKDSPLTDAWGALSKVQPTPHWEQALVALGDAAARRMTEPGRSCLSAGDESMAPRSEAYWRGYWITALVDAVTDCAPRGDTGWVRTYRAAERADDPALLRYAALRPLLGDERRASAHLALVQPLAEHCPMPSDPWGICAWAGTAQSRRWQTESSRRLPLRPNQRFRADALSAPAVATPTDLDAAISLLQRHEGRELPQLRNLLTRLATDHTLEVTRRWWHPASPVRALELVTVRQQGGNGELLRSLILYGSVDPPRQVQLPGGYGQYDDGDLAALSDLDGDGRPEVWFAGTWGECDGEGGIAPRDCSRTAYQLGGEVFGDRLGPYVVNPSHPAANGP